MQRKVIVLDYEDGLRERLNFKLLYLELNHTKPTKRLLREHFRKHSVTLRKLTEILKNARLVGDSFGQSDQFKNFLSEYQNAMKNMKVENRAVLRKDRSVLQQIIYLQLDKIAGMIAPDSKLANINKVITGLINLKLDFYKTPLNESQKQILSKKTYKIISQIDLANYHKVYFKLLQSNKSRKKLDRLPLALTKKANLEDLYLSIENEVNEVLRGKGKFRI